jgi:hypothetical protein
MDADVAGVKLNINIKHGLDPEIEFNAVELG